MTKNEEKTGLKPKRNKSMIGNIYPFFLDNSDLKSYYLYRIVSPEYLTDLTPLLSFDKIGERTRKGDFSSTKTDMRNGDLLMTIMKGKRFRGTMLEFLEKEISSGRGKDEKFDSNVLHDNGDNFPLFELEGSGLLTKLVLINLRDSIRWTKYHFTAGNYVDIMLTSDTFGVFKIVGNDKSVHLELENVYENSDVELTNPLSDVKLSKSALGVVSSLREEFSGDRRASDLNRAIRQAEWKSFD